MPELQVDVPGQPVFFEHHTVLWKQTSVKIEMRKLHGAMKRKIAGGGIDVREHQFLAASDNIDFSFERINGVPNMLFGGGFFVDKFRAKHEDGIVFVHGHGNVMVIELAQGEEIDVEPGGWLYKDLSVKMSAHTTG